MFKKLSYILIAFAIPSLSFGQFQLIEKVEPQAGKTIIPFEKWKLTSNDLTLIIHEDHSDPIVHVEVAYHVGSARESVRNSGFAHFFEHMMFQGSKHVEDEEHFKVIASNGGTNNAFTAFDKTVYHQTAPANLTETMLWLEADRMGTHLDGFTQKKFDNQRAAVKNEKRERYDNQPYGMLNEVLFKTLFANHPYEWTPIGYVDDLDAASFEDLRNFFLRWYGPNNATIVVSGDVNPEQVKAWVEKYYGTINKVKPIKKAKAQYPILAQDIYVDIPDNIYLPLQVMAWPTVEEFHKDEAALDVLGYVLGGNSNSPLYKKFIKSELAVQASSSGSSLELAGLFSIDVVANYNGLNAKEIEAKIREVLAEFDKNECSIEDINAAKAINKTNIINTLNSIDGKSLSLSHWAMMLNKPFNLQNQIDRYDNVTKEDVMRVFRTYILGKNAVILNVYREEPKEDDKNVSKSINPHANEPKVSDAQYVGLSYTPPVDNFDRASRPKIEAAKPIKIPSFYKESFDNGLKLIGTQNTESPMVYLYLEMEGGQILENGKFNTGTASITAAMMNEGTKTKTSEEYEKILSSMGSRISFGSGSTSTSVFISTQKVNIDKTLALFKEVLTEPRFDAADFKRVKKNYIEGTNNYKSSPQTMLEIAFYKNMFKGTALEEYENGTFKSISKIKLDDLKGYYSQFYAPNVATLTISGDISKEEILSKIDFLKSWSKKTIAPISIGTMPKIEKTQILLIDKPYAAQSLVRICQPAATYSYNGDFFKSTVMNFPLGGTFNSRITLNVREDKGYAYSPRCAFVGNKYYGYYTWGANIKKEATDSAINEVMKEIKNYISGGITDAELDFTKKAINLSEALDYESPIQKLGFLSRIVSYDLPNNYTEEQSNLVSGLTKEQINEIAKKNLNPNAMYIIVVGHGYKIREALNKMGYGKVKEISID